MLENLAWLPFGSLMIGSKFPRRLSKFLENLEWTLFDVTQGASLASSKVQSLSLCVLDIWPWRPLPGTLLFHILALFFSPINLNFFFFWTGIPHILDWFTHSYYMPPEAVIIWEVQITGLIRVTDLIICFLCYTTDQGCIFAYFSSPSAWNIIEM